MWFATSAARKSPVFLPPSEVETFGYALKKNVSACKTMLINHCSDGKECTEEQHQRNRRVEFRVIDVDETLDFISQEDTKYEE